MHACSIGADPEFFVQRNGHYISGHIFPFGPKEKPFKGETGHFQNDGVALELNTEPMYTEDGFVIQFGLAKAELAQRLKEMDPACSLVVMPTVNFTKAYLDGLPEPVRELGCREDYDAWDETVNEKPNANVTFRTGSGHVHLGWTHSKSPKDAHHFDNCCILVRELDYWVGLPSLMWDNDTQRRALYGKAGAFRPKPYGLEYRTLSNAWCRTEALVRQVYRQVRKGWDHYTQYMEQGGKPLLQDTYGEFARAAINESARDWANVEPELFETICGARNAS